MTFAPANLTAVRRLLLDHLDIRENSNAYPTDLDPAEVGIVGDPAHRGGYHCGRDRLDSDDYSVRESGRDRAGLTEAASALDIGQWSTRVAGKSHTLASMSIWLVAQCKAGTADSKDIREIIYSPDGNVVRRWDRLGRRTSGDSSHRWHTHISYHRDATRAGRDLTPLFRRYLTEIGLLEDDMPLTAQDLDKIRSASAKGLYDALTVAVSGKDFRDLRYSGEGSIGASVRANFGALAAGPVLAALDGRDFTDEPAIVAGVLAGLSPESIAAAIPLDLADRVADELARRLAAGG